MGRDRIRTMFLDMNVVPGSTIDVDPGTFKGKNSMCIGGRYSVRSYGGC